MIEGLLVFVSVLGSGCGQARAAIPVLVSKTFLVLNSQNRFLLKMIRTSTNTRVHFGWLKRRETHIGSEKENVLWLGRVGSGVCSHQDKTILVETKVVFISRPTLRHEC